MPLLRFVLIGALCGTLLSVCTVGHTGNNKILVKRKLIRLSRILEMDNPHQRNIRLLGELHETFDYNAFEQKVLQDSAGQFTPSQRTRFSSAFQRMFEHKLIALSNDDSLHCEDYKVSEGLRESDVVITCKTRNAADHITLHFKSARSKKVVDFSMGNALLSRNYRGVINKSLRTHGAEELIKKIVSKSTCTLNGKSLF